MITDVADYFAKGCGRCPRFDTPECSTRTWATGLATLRDICRAQGLEEAARWGHPTYFHGERRIVIFGAFRRDFRLSFFNPGLMKDPAGVLEPAGPNTVNAGTWRFSDNDEPAQQRDLIAAYLSEAISYAEAGSLAPKVVREVPIPDELTEALDADPELAEAFNALTPGRQKSYAFNLNQAKKAETRIARIEKFRPKILAGKGAQEY